MPNNLDVIQEIDEEEEDSVQSSGNVVRRNP